MSLHCCSPTCQKNFKLQVEQLDKLDQYTTPTDGVAAEDEELVELMKEFYQAAVQVCVCVFLPSKGGFM